jgi:hypothetical protein
MKPAARATLALTALATLLACGGLMPLGDPIPEGEPAMLNLPGFNNIWLGMNSDDAGWAAPDVLDGGLDARESLGASSANCKMMLDVPTDYTDPTKGYVVGGMRCVMSKEWPVDRLQQAWGPPDAVDTYEIDGKKITEQYWVNEADRVRAQLEDSERSSVLLLEIRRFDPVDEILGEGKLYPFQTRRWVGERMNRMEDQKMFMQGRHGFVDAYGIPRYGHRPRVWLSHEVGDKLTLVVGWSMKLHYRSDEAHRDAIVEAVTRKVGKKPKKKGKRWVFGDAAHTELIDTGTALKLTVGKVPAGE